MLFIDSTDPEELERFKRWGVVDGVAVNLLTLAVEVSKGESVTERIRRMLPCTRGNILVPLMARSAQAMIEEAQRLIGSISPRIVPGIPCTEEGLCAMPTLTISLRDGRQAASNATHVMTFEQAYLAARAGARYVSISYGQIKEIRGDAHFVVRRTREVFDKQRMRTEIIADCLSSPEDVAESLKAGAHIAVATPGILEQMLRHPVTDQVLQQDQGHIARLKL